MKNRITICCSNPSTGYISEENFTHTHTHTHTPRISQELLPIHPYVTRESADERHLGDLTHTEAPCVLLAHGQKGTGP